MSDIAPTLGGMGIDIRSAVIHAAQLADDAKSGTYTVDGAQVDEGQVACILAEFLDRVSPETAPHGWRCNHEGFTFRASAWGGGRTTG